jgi:predicted transcriptional regulator
MHNLYTTRAANAKKNPVENQFERACAQLLRVGITRKHEPIVLEALREHAEPGAIPEEELEQIAATIEERVERPRERILAQCALHETQESIERPAHVDWVPVRQNPAWLA